MKKNALYIAWVISLLGVLLSLYWSEILGKEPCSFCWYQRTALFPLALLLGVAAYRDDRSFSLYGLVLSAAGFFFALLQIGARFFFLCSSGCAETSPLSIFSLFGFALIFFLLKNCQKTENKPIPK